MADLSIKVKIFGGLWGAVVGDALGVPMEFESREPNAQC
jgi:ADP-ribosylglycohydrolase